MAKPKPHSLDTTDLSIADILLDDRNPRLPERIRGADQPSLIQFVAENYDAIAVARSIASHGYFPSEPLIVLKYRGRYIAVEGNRRLAALKLLSLPQLRKSLDLEDSDEWEGLSEDSQVPEKVPVVLVPNRRSVAPIIGYRHISGIEPWEPWAKARFITSLIEEVDLDFDEVSDEVGESAPAVRAIFRNYKIIEYAKRARVQTGRAESLFGVFTRALNSEALREHIGAPSPSQVDKDTAILPRGRRAQVTELLGWLFGKDAQPPVIGESRDITRLGTVVGSPPALDVLRRTRDLDEAFVAAGGLRDRLIGRLTRALVELQRAQEDIPAHANDDHVLSLLDQLRGTIDTAISSVEAGDDHSSGKG